MRIWIFVQWSHLTVHNVHFVIVVTPVIGVVLYTRDIGSSEVAVREWLLGVAFECARGPYVTRGIGVVVCTLYACPATCMPKQLTFDYFVHLYGPYIQGLAHTGPSRSVCIVCSLSFTGYGFGVPTR